MARIGGVAQERKLPTFTRQTLFDRLDEVSTGPPADEAEQRVLLFPDTFTKYVDPEPGLAAVRTLAAAGVHVAVPRDLGPSGRAAYSVGRLDLARDRAQANVDRLAGRLADGWDVVAVEPSDAVMFQDEYLTLLGADDAATFAAHSYSVCEYLSTTGSLDRLTFQGNDTRIAYHGHCHQHAMGTDGHAVEVLRAAGYDTIELNTGCCGMAGSFGYEVEHYDLSMAIADLVVEQVDAASPDVVAATGISCRSQLDGRSDVTVPIRHPIELVDQAIAR